MKKTLLVLVALIALAGMAHGQIYAPKGVNYGQGFIIKETSGTGAPNASCTGFVRYWQTDAATSPMWECLSGTMVNIGASTSGNGSPSYAVTTTATGLQTLSGPLQAPSYQIGSSNLNLFACGPNCMGAGSVVGTSDATLNLAGVTASVNGMLNATLYSGTDIGAKVNSALSYIPGGGTVIIPDGTYSFSTTMVVGKAGQHLLCSRGTVLNYTGSSDAIVFVTNPVAGQTAWTMDGEGGCTLNGSGATGTPNGVRILPSNNTAVRNMHITNFAGDAIRLDGANEVEVYHNTLSGNGTAIYLTTMPSSQTTPYNYSGSGAYAPNAVHVVGNEINGNTWGYYSNNGGYPITRSLASVIRDNTFELNKTGDMYLSWDARTSVTNNYFESSGVAISAGAGSANVFSIEIAHNYFTAQAYRSDIEIGYGYDFYIHDNYEDGGSGNTTGCAINLIPGPNGTYSNVMVANGFSRNSEGATTTNELCYKGSPISSTGGTFRIESGASIAGGATVGGNLTVNGIGFFGPTLNVNGSEYGVDTTLPVTGTSCSPEAFVHIEKNSPAHMHFCSGGIWRLIY